MFVLFGSLLLFSSVFLGVFCRRWADRGARTIGGLCRMCGKTPGYFFDRKVEPSVNGFPVNISPFERTSRSHL